VKHILLWGCLLKINLSKRSKKQWDRKTPRSQLSSSPDAWCAGVWKWSGEFTTYLRFVVNKRAISPIWVVVRTGFAAGVVPVSLRVFSGHTTMMYTMKVGSTTFTNLGRHQGLDLHWIFNDRVDIYTPSSTVKDGDYRVVEIRILKSGRKYQPKLIINIISQW